MTISKHQAAQLAKNYHDAFTMVSQQSTFGVDNHRSARQILDDYLRSCEVCGVTLHNEHWEAYAEKIVQRLTEKRRAAWASLKGAVA